jgi:lipoprotein-anchoring transpeptidase ErfK/SrfK
MKEINIPSKLTRHAAIKKPKKRHYKPLLFIVLLLILAVTVWYFSILLNPASTKNVSQSTTNPVSNNQKVNVSKPIIGSNVCSGNAINQNIIVSIDQRHLWACAKNKQVFNTAVITGYTGIPGDVTPLGIYEIYAKQTDRYLSGTDGVSSWHDYVYYWMPFLNNEYGTYGLHDATWRTNVDFGNISPSSPQASHGCVELPLTAATWLFNWATIGTAVTIQA